MASSNPSRDRFERVEQLFHAALAVDPERRVAFLLESSNGDEALAEEVGRLLDADASTPSREDPLAPPSESSRARALETFAEPRNEPSAGTIVGAWRLESRLGEGGMGTVWLASRADAVFAMKAAVKLLRENRFDRRSSARFELERHALARLDHPGIARLLDGGTREDGTPWLAMELVSGERIDLACDRRRATLDARIDSMIEVCAAVDHAHRRLLVHRDLKPSNVLLDTEGRARLLDFGIAKLIEGAAALDDRAPFQPGGPAHELTAPDERILTPRYASPEQIRGEQVGVASDVYSLGVLLHELLCGRSPYLGETESRYALEKAVCEAPPAKPSAAVQLHETAHNVSADAIASARSTSVERLVAALRGDLDHIVQRCLEKDPDRRYASAADLGADLRRFRTGQPVHARGDAFTYRAAKFVRRFPAASTISALLLLTITLALVAHFRVARRNSELLAHILPLADLKLVRDLRQEAATLWPMRPERSADFSHWLERARELVARRPEHESSLAAVDSLQLEDDQARWLKNAIDDLLTEYAQLETDDSFGDTVSGVERRLALANQLSETSLDDPALALAWKSTIADIAASPVYSGLRLVPQMGLIPLGADPASGLQEFGHVQSGACPARNAEGVLELDAESGIVMILLPGGEAQLGAQSDDPSLPAYDPDAKPEEGPPRHETIAPFFVGKHEVTQAQWGRITGTFPSAYPPGSRFGAQTTTLRNPVEQVHRLDAARGLFRVDLELPTEDLWEYACRAGTDEPFDPGTHAGADTAPLADFANFADRFARNNGGAVNWQYSDDQDDGATIHTTIGCYRPNRFGLHDGLGNVWEWCVDDIHGRENKDGVARGGGFFNPPAMLRASGRYFVTRDFRSHSLGLRAARRIDGGVDFAR